MVRNTRNSKVVTAPVVTAPVVTAPVVTAPVVTAPVAPPQAALGKAGHVLQAAQAQAALLAAQAAQAAAQTVANTVTLRGMAKNYASPQQKANLQNATVFVAKHTAAMADNCTITLLVAGNPKAAGSSSAARFNAIYNGCTIGYLRQKYGKSTTNLDLAWNLNRAFIAVNPA